MTFRRSAALAVTACVLGMATVVVPVAPVTGPAGAWSDGACPTVAGVTVVVDFQDLGGGVVVRCTDTAVASGLDALDRAGFVATTALRQWGFVCKIDAKPADAGCVNASPASAYWSYWTAPRGGQWCYSNEGASRAPAQGTVEGWSFSLDRPVTDRPTPRATPPPAVPGSPASSTPHCTTASTPPPSTTAPIPTSPRADVSSSGGTATPPRTGATSPSGGATAPTSAPAAAPGAGAAPPAPSAAATDGDPAPPTTVDPTRSDSAGSTDARSTDSAAPAGDPDEGDEMAADATRNTTPGTSSSPVGLVVALIIIGALTATSAVVRRRTAAP